MDVRRKAAAFAAVLAGVSGVMMASAPPAAAVGGCPSGKLCLYRSTEYRTMSFEAASTSACFELDDYGLTYPFNGINSYVNNLPVKATLYHSEPTGWYAMSTIRPGGFSSNTGALTADGYWYRYSEKICTGSATP
ncbi:peptidase inhibitor family I36 protein [Streptomyces sp. NPDC059874]|uniref:peptidase inhibitor family I36 protein n=1 Tax=Streptomyces sp. NPDC059874 TaxID=3346983 RepID=UPI00365B7A44